MPSVTTPQIKAGLRTLAQFVPLVGGAMAQAWSEYESLQINERVETFFTEMRLHILALEQQDAVIQQRLQSMPDAATLLEDVVDAVQHETADEKRRVFAGFFLNLVLESDSNTPDQRRFLVETLDALTLFDLAMLRKFVNEGYATGNDLVGMSPSMYDLRIKAMGIGSEFEMEKEFGSIMICTAKLEARALIVDAPNLAASSSNVGTWHSGYMRRRWKLMPVGEKLLKTLPANV